MRLPWKAPMPIEEPPGNDDELLLAPIAGPRPTGRDVRYEGDYELIIEARREDNAALPQGVWLHDLKRADWADVQRLCTDSLSTRSKDLQIASWLTEALVHLQGFAGLAHGFALLGELCERFWPDLYPAIEEGDLSGRVAPLEWLNEKLPSLLRSQPIVRSAADPDEHFSWTDYVNAQRLETLRQRDAGSAERSEAAGAVTLARFAACRQRTETALLNRTEAELKAALQALEFLNALLQQHCGKEAPGLGAIRSAIEDLLAFVAVELADRPKPASLLSSLRKQPSPPIADTPTGPAAEATEPAQPPRTREEAYRQLSEIAEFLLRTEPHSPTPYLIQRAASWGEMPLPELVQELSRSGSDVSMLLGALGLLQPSAEIDREDDQRGAGA
jgi:type VI secretion system protein ImpA